MGDTLFHSISSAKKFGGVYTDYTEIHALLDSSKLFLADWRHRSLLHNTFGIFLLEKLIGTTFERKSDGVPVCTRTILTEHIMEDLGAVPTPGEFLREMPLRGWMTRISEAAKKRMQSLTLDGQGSKENCVLETIKWNLFATTPPKVYGYYMATVTCVESGSLLGLRNLFWDGTDWYFGQSLGSTRVNVKNMYTVQYWAAPVGPSMGEHDEQ